MLKHRRRFKRLPKYETLLSLGREPIQVRTGYETVDTRSHR